MALVNKIGPGAFFNLVRHSTKHVGSKKVDKADNNIKDVLNLKLEPNGQKGVTANKENASQRNNVKAKLLVLKDILPQVFELYHRLTEILVIFSALNLLW